jgi:hypothetical protein
MEEMEKRSRRRTRDLVTQAASQGLSQNEIGCARISMMARSINAPCKGRIQMRKTSPLHLFTFGLQRTAGQRTSHTHGGRSVSCHSGLMRRVKMGPIRSLRRRGYERGTNI